MSGTNDTLSALKAAIAAGGTPAPLAKDFTFTQNSNPTQGLQDYDLSPAVLNLYPQLTPLRNMIPRVSGGFGSQANWKAVTAIDTTKIHGGVSEGHRGSVVGVQTKEYFAAYRTLGSESAVTDEAVLAAADFDDVRARAADSGLKALMRVEERTILAGNTSFQLGQTPTPTLVAATTGGAIPASTAVSVVCVALSYDGVYRANVATGIQGTYQRQTADGYLETVNNGVAVKSASVNVTTNSASTANMVTATVPAVRGAFGYGWYVGAIGAEMLMAVTTVSQLVITALPTMGQMATALAASDSSTDSLVHDGLLTMASNPSNGALFMAAAAGTGLTASGDGGIVEFDNVLQAMWDTLRLSPGSMWISSQEQRSIRSKILGGGSASANARFTFNVQQGQIVGGGMAKGYLNPYSTGNGPAEIPLNLHPDMPAGTVLFLTHELPYQVNNVDNILQIKCRKDYYQTEWPRKTRSYEYGVYTDQVLQNKFMPGMAMLTNLSKV